MIGIKLQTSSASSDRFTNEPQRLPLSLFVLLSNLKQHPIL